LLSIINAPTAAKIYLAFSARANAYWTACLPRFDDHYFGVTSFDQVVSALSLTCLSQATAARTRRRSTPPDNHASHQRKGRLSGGLFVFCSSRINRSVGNWATVASPALFFPHREKQKDG
jgi:hypothetical protein